MKLIDVTIHSFRRLRRTKVNLDGKLVALIGPNESGKTSFLEALRQLEEPTEDINVSDFTDRITPTAHTEIIEARYLLEEEDVAAIQDINQKEKVRWFIYGRWANGKIYTSVEPRPHRDLSRRHQLARRLERLLQTKGIKQRMSDNSEDEDVAQLRKSLETLKSTDETLSADDINTLSISSASAGKLAQEGMRSAEPLARDLVDVAKQETEDRPLDVARSRLAERRPNFLWFGTEERDLRSEYELDAAAGDTPIALKRLAQLARLDIKQLRAATRAENWGKVETLRTQANARLGDFFSQTWRQANVAVHFVSDVSTLRVLASKEAGGFTTIAERSDGFRAFVALTAFTAAHDLEARPILLIDEAETHLHYDAQADLIRMLTRQNAASQVIFTTHSAGCLPEDLGTGIRVVQKTPGSDHSTITNAFWERGSGYTPLLIGMGASAMAFAPSRRALIAEGASELIMLPTLLREAIDEEELNFQVAPGLSEVNLKIAEELELQAPRVAYLVDGDTAGAAIAAKLRSAGIPGDRIIHLGGENSGLVLEDFVHKQVYEIAVKEELRRSHGDDVATYRTTVSPNRPAHLMEWCNDHSLPVPSKRALAQRIVELRLDNQLLQGSRRAKLRSLHRQATKILDAIRS